MGRCRTAVTRRVGSRPPSSHASSTADHAAALKEAVMQTSLHQRPSGLRGPPKSSFGVQRPPRCLHRLCPASVGCHRLCRQWPHGPRTAVSLLGSHFPSSFPCISQLHPAVARCSCLRACPVPGPRQCCCRTHWCCCRWTEGCVLCSGTAVHRVGSPCRRTQMCPRQSPSVSH